MQSTIPLSEAKAKLSAVVEQVRRNGSEFIVTVRNEPCAVIAPIPVEPPEKLKAFGALSSSKPAPAREDEKASFAEAMAAKHA